MEKLDERQLLEKFDRLVEQGLVVYNQNYRLINLSDQGFSVSSTVVGLTLRGLLTLRSSNFASSAAWRTNPRRRAAIRKPPRCRKQTSRAADRAATSTCRASRWP
jgi:hypothetical protein